MRPEPSRARVPHQALAGHTLRKEAVANLSASAAPEDSDDRGRLTGKALLCAKDAAHYLSVSASVFRDLVAEGLAPEPVLDRGRLKRWCRLELLAWTAHDCPPSRRWRAQWALIRKSVAQGA